MITTTIKSIQDIMCLLKPGGRCGIGRLPNGVFNPYTGIRTNLIFFEKGRPSEGIWYYEHPYPEGYKSYSKTKPMRIEEFAPEKAWWTARTETERIASPLRDQLAAYLHGLSE